MQSRCDFQNVNFPKINKTNMLKKKQKYFLSFWVWQELTLILRILIKDEKSGLSSFLKDI